MVSLVIGVLLLILAGLLPLCVCAILARRDAIRRERRFGRRIFYTGLVASAVFAVCVVLFFFSYLAQQVRPPNTNVRLAWGGVLFGSGLVFLVATFTSAIGYAISYRIFDRGSVSMTDPSIDPLINPNTHVGETGNPYQPPSI